MGHANLYEYIPVDCLACCLSAEQLHSTAPAVDPGLTDSRRKVSTPWIKVGHMAKFATKLKDRPNFALISTLQARWVQ
jgi:hypothetical protein